MMTPTAPCHTTLHQWALRNGFIPYRHARDQQTGAEVELISFPFFDGDVVKIKARTTPDDPTTMVDIDWPNWRLTVLPEKET